MLNNVFCPFKKAEKNEPKLQHSIWLLSTGYIRPELMPKGIVRPWVCDRRVRHKPRSAYYKIDKAQRHQYSTFDVGRSMFDVQSFFVSGLTRLGITVP